MWRGVSLPVRWPLVAASLVPIGIGLVVAAPWINIPYLQLPRLIAFDALGHVSKTDLSLWRLGHVLAVAYLTALLVPASAAWLRSRAATWIVNCGRNGLDIFCLGTVLSFCGFIVMLEAGRSWEYQLSVNILGIGGMLCTASWLTQRKTMRAPVAKVGHAASTTSQAPVDTGVLPPA